MCSLTALPFPITNKLSIDRSVIHVAQLPSNKQKKHLALQDRVMLLTTKVTLSSLLHLYPLTQSHPSNQQKKHLAMFSTLILLLQERVMLLTTKVTLSSPLHLCPLTQGHPCHQQPCLGSPAQPSSQPELDGKTWSI